VLLKTFAIDVLVALGLGGERFQLLIGLGFLVIVLWSPDGILGLWDRWRESRGRDPLLDPRGGPMDDRTGDRRGDRRVDSR